MYIRKCSFLKYLTHLNLRRWQIAQMRSSRPQKATGIQTTARSIFEEVQQRWPSVPTASRSRLGNRLGMSGCRCVRLRIAYTGKTVYWIPSLTLGGGVQLSPPPTQLMWSTTIHCDPRCPRQRRQGPSHHHRAAIAHSAQRMRRIGYAWDA